MSKRALVLIGVLGALAVGLGAFGAHGLKNQLAGGLITVDQLNGFDTGVKYQMYHTLAMLVVFLLSQKKENRYFKLSWYFFLIGILLFSGSLYFLTTRNLYNADFLKVLGPVTPIGGLFFLLGWIMFIPAAYSKEKED
ncbi:MAG TPA: DUF423 domain-containing protein [Bacteroidia bacterium]|nr:DUF423 domain-containing protein [Bacteroidia bacterium]